MVLDQMTKNLGASFNRKEFKGETTSIQVAGNPVLLLKPHTLMNRSGESVLLAASYHNVDIEQIIVVHDDIDLPFGRIKVKSDGGHGGHNGLRSIMAHLGSSSFERVRIGIGRPEDCANDDVANYVLSDFAKGEQPKLNEALDAAEKAAISIIEYGITSAMNRFNASV